jgi:CheY-like chemotaxis protein
VGARTAVLVVDDHAGVRRLLADVLRRHLADRDPEVLQADGAAAARRWIGAVRPALVLADLWLPDPADGLAFVRRLKADPATAALPVLVLGATTPERAAARAAGADAALAKPFTAAQLAAAVRALLDGR